MKALILVDIQNDFVTGGALAVAHGDEVVAVANRLAASGDFDLVVASQDWHPKDHKSFASNYFGRKVGEVIALKGVPQILWPDHCVQGTKGAAFVNELNLKNVDVVFQKGVDAEVDSYSAFFDNDKTRSTGLGEFLRSKSVELVFVMGLATDYCVKFTALDAKSFGFKTTLIKDGCRAVKINPNDENLAIQEMEKAGIEVIDSTKV